MPNLGLDVRGNADSSKICGGRSREMAELWTITFVSGFWLKVVVVVLDDAMDRSPVCVGAISELDAA